MATHELVAADLKATIPVVLDDQDGPVDLTDATSVVLRIQPIDSSTVTLVPCTITAPTVGGVTATFAVVPGRHVFLGEWHAVFDGGTEITWPSGARDVIKVRAGNLPA